MSKKYYKCSIVAFLFSMSESGSVKSWDVMKVMKTIYTVPATGN